MAAIARLICGTCGEEHDFCLYEASLFSNTDEYEYVCPTMRLRTRIACPDKWDEVPYHCPKGSVVVTRIG